MKQNAKNERTKREFLRWLKNARGRCNATVNAVEKALLLYQDFTGNEDLGLFRPDKAIDFKKWLQKREFRGSVISPATYCAHLKNLMGFFEWLSWQIGYKTKIKRTSVDYLRVTDKEERMASQRTPRNFPSLDYVVKMAGSIQAVTEIDLRDRALISFTLLSGMRDQAVVTLPLGCFDENKLLIDQNPRRGVATKFSKLIPTTIFRFDEVLLAHVLEWVKHLKGKGFGSRDPIFPRAKTGHGPDGLSFETASEVGPAFWEGTSRMRDIFKKRASIAGLPYFPPHTFRHLAVDLALKSCKTGEEIKAISQNFGHEHVATTMSAYANYPPERLTEIIGRLGFEQKPANSDACTLEEIKALILKRK